MSQNLEEELRMAVKSPNFEEDLIPNENYLFDSDLFSATSASLDERNQLDSIITVGNMCRGDTFILSRKLIKDDGTTLQKTYLLKLLSTQFAGLSYNQYRVLCKLPEHPVTEELLKGKSVSFFPLIGSTDTENEKYLHMDIARFCESFMIHQPISAINSRHHKKKFLVFIRPFVSKEALANFVDSQITERDDLPRLLTIWRLDSIKLSDNRVLYHPIFWFETYFYNSEFIWQCKEPLESEALKENLRQKGYSGNVFSEYHDLITCSSTNHPPLISSSINNKATGINFLLLRKSPWYSKHTYADADDDQRLHYKLPPTGRFIGCCKHSILNFNVLSLKQNSIYQPIELKVTLPFFCPPDFQIRRGLTSASWMISLAHDLFLLDNLKRERYIFAVNLAQFPRVLVHPTIHVEMFPNTRAVVSAADEDWSDEETEENFTPTVAVTSSAATTTTTSSTNLKQPFLRDYEVADAEGFIRINDIADEDSMTTVFAAIVPMYMSKFLQTSEFREFVETHDSIEIENFLKKKKLEIKKEIQEDLDYFAFDLGCGEKKADTELNEVDQKKALDAIQNFGFVTTCVSASLLPYFNVPLWQINPIYYINIIEQMFPGISADSVTRLLESMDKC